MCSRFWCVLALGLALGAVGLAATEPAPYDQVFYFGGAGHQRLHAAHVLSNGTVLLGGSADDFAWVPEGLPVVELSAAGLSSASDGPVGFVLQVTADLVTPLRLLRFPAGTVPAVHHLRSSEVPGQPTGLLYLSGTRVNSTDPVRQIPNFAGGHFIARLDANFVDASPAGLSWVREVYASGIYSSLQPWDVAGDGRVVFAGGASNSSSEAYLEVVTAANAWHLMPGWRRHQLADGSWVTGDLATVGTPENPVVRSRFMLMNTSAGGPRSTTWADFDAITPDGNGGWRKGTQPQDLFGYGPTTAGGRGYTGYRASSSSFGIGQIAVDRRDGSIYIPHNTQSNHADNQPDFEPAFTALTADGQLKWWSRLYTEFQVAEGVARSSNGADAWAAANNGLTNRFVRSVAVSPANSQVVLAGTYGGVFRSSDAGANWTVASGLPSDARVTALAFGPGPSGPRAWAATSLGAWRSDDQGATWSNASGDLPVGYLTTLGVHPGDPLRAWGGTGGQGVFRTSDGGATWVAVNTGLDAEPNNLWVNGLAVDPQEPDVLWSVSAGGWGIAKSTDGGLSWVASNAGTPASGWRDYVFTVAVHRPTVGSPARVWIGSNAGAFVSPDGGATWQNATSGLVTQVRAFALHPTDANIVYAGTNYRGLFRSLDGGATWTRQNTGLSYTGQTVSSLHHVVYGLALDPANASTVYLASLGFPFGSIPDQYGDAAAVDYAKSGADAEVLVVARSHGGDVKNLWHGNSISTAQNPLNPGYGYRNQFTGSNGNIHTSWVGKFRADNGTLLYATRLAELVYSNSQSVGNVSTVPEHDGWPDPNGGWPDLNTTRTDGRRLTIDALGRALVTAPGRLVHTTRDAFQKVPNRYRRVSLTGVTAADRVTATDLLGNEQITPSAGTIKITSSGTNLNVVRTITDFNPATGEIVVDAPWPALPAVGNTVTIDEGASGWSSFVRTFTPDLARLVYSSVLTGDFDRSVMSSATGGDNTTIFQVIPHGDGLLAVGWHQVSGEVSKGNAMPTRLVPPWGRTTPLGEEAIVARLVYQRPAQVYVEASEPFALEGGAPGALRFTRTGGVVTEPLTVAFMIEGTAVNGADYAALPGQLTFAAGESTMLLPITPVDDTRVEDDETVIVTLRMDEPAFYAGSLARATVTIIDNDGPGRLRFTLPAWTVAEGIAGSTVELVVERIGGSAGAVTVSYATADGSAVAGSDYVATSGTLSWADGEFVPRTILVQVLEDGVLEALENFSVVLTQATGGAQLVAPTVATVALEDTYVPGAIGFAETVVSEERARGFANLIVRRTGGSSGAITVPWRTVALTAVAGEDFLPVGGELTWAHGDSQPRVITVPLVTTATGPAELLVELVSASGGATLTPAQVRLQLVDRRAPGTVRLARAAASVEQSATHAVLVVRRLGGSQGAASVDFATSEGTALAGVDYTATTGTVSWADGEDAAREILIPVLRNVAATGPQTFTVTLGEPSAGVILAEPTVATVTLLDDDQAAITWNNAAGDWIWDSTAANWNSPNGRYGDGDAVHFNTTGQTATANSIALAAGGVSPARTGLDVPGSATTTGFQWVGGVINGSGAVVKTGTGIARFGIATARYTQPFGFSGGTWVKAGTLELLAAPGAAASWAFGSGPIMLDGGRLRTFLTAQHFENDFVVTANGGVLSFNSSQNGVPVEYSGTFELAGNLSLAGTGGGNLGGYGHRLTGDIFIDGERRIERIENHGNTNFALLGNLRDGRTPGRLRLASKIDRIWYLGGADNSYTGGTIIESVAKTLNLDTVGGSGGYSANRAIVVEPASRLGTGDVEVQAGGFLVLRGAANLDPDATLTIASGGVVTVEAGVVTPVGRLVLGGVTQPAGFYTSTNAAGYLYGPGAVLVVAPTVTVEATTPVASVGLPGAFQFRRAGSVAGVLTVPVVLSGMGVAGLDYEALPGEVTFADGEATVALPVTALRVPPAPVSVGLTVGPDAGWQVGDPNHAVVTVTDPAGPGLLRLAADAVTVSEADELVTLTVQRVGGSAGAVTVSWSLVPGTAEAGVDFVAASGEVVFADGQLGGQSVNVALLDNVHVQAARSFQMVLGVPTGGATLGAPGATTITVLDDDGLTLTWSDTTTGTRPWNRTAAVWSGPLATYRDGVHVLFTATGAGAVAIDAGGVSPASTTFNTGSTYTVTGGSLLTGSLTKQGSGTLTFGNSGSPLPANTPFPGGVTVTGGELSLFTNVNGSVVNFGTGPIVLNGGNLRYVAPCGNPSTTTNGSLANSIEVGPSGTRIYLKQSAGSTSGHLSGPIALRGPLSFRGVGGGLAPNGQAVGDSLSGRITVHGEQTITREDRHNNMNASLLGGFADGDTPGSPRLVNRLGRWFYVDGVSTHTGTTFFGATSAFTPSTVDYSVGSLAVTLLSSAQLGDGDTVVETGGLAWFQGSGNLRPGTSLTVQTGGFVVLSAGVELVVRVLTLGTDVFTEGTFSAVSHPSSIVGPVSATGTIRVVYTPDAPTDLEALALSPTAMHLTWVDRSLVPVSFALERRTLPDGDWTAVATVPPPASGATPEFTDDGLSAQTAYAWRVRASHPNGDSAWSAEATATTLTPGVPAAPTDLVAMGVAPDAVQLLWTAPTGSVTGFRVERHDGQTWTLAAALEGADHAGYLDGGRVAGATYAYRVASVNNQGTSAWSNLAATSTPPSLRPFEVWSQDYFTPAERVDAQISGPLADPDGDGWPNLLEYALGRDPLAVEASALVLPALGGAEGSYPTFTYRRRIGATSLTYTVQWAAGLTGPWQQGVGLTPVGDPVPTGDGLTEQVTVRLDIPWTEIDAVFLRLRVIQTP